MDRMDYTYSGDSSRQNQEQYIKVAKTQVLVHCKKKLSSRVAPLGVQRKSQIYSTGNCMAPYLIFPSGFI